MKKLLIALALALPAVALNAQSEQAPAADPADWKANFKNLSHEERGALYTDPNVDQEELRAYLESLRIDNPGYAARSSSSGGGGEGFSCDAWYNHNQLESEFIFPDDWMQFEGGCGANGAVDAFFGPIDIPFDFCFFGQSFSEVYINTKGTVTFDEPMCDWTPEAIPNADYDQIAGFWQDGDFTAAGYVQYEVLPDAIVITFIDQGYYNGNADLVNTFQIIITDGASTVLGAGNNVGFLYQDMQWAHGDVGANGGFDGPSPAVVGVDDAGTENGFQIARINFNTDEYDGPYNGSDGIDWLDYKSFIFSICDENGEAYSNYPPVSSDQIGGINGELPDVANCDTIFVCTNEFQDFGLTYLSPEDDQLLTIEFDDPSGVIQDVTEVGEDWVTIAGTIFGDPTLQGDHTVTVTVTDNGTPAQSLTQTFIVSVLELEAPVMEILGDSVFCSIDGTLLTVEPSDLDYYDWSFDSCDGSPECQVNFNGTVTVEGFLGPCKNTASIDIDPSDYFIPGIEPEPIFLCSDECAEVCSEDEWAEYFWEVWDAPEGIDNSTAEICTDDPTAACIEVRPGYYRLQATDEAGCEGQNIFQIFDASYVPPALPDTLFCNELTPLDLVGIGAPEEGTLNIYLDTDDPDGWNEAYLVVTVTSAPPSVSTNQYIITMPEGLAFYNTSVNIETFAEITVEYVPGSSDGNDLQSVWLFNCDNNNVTTYAGANADNIDGSDPDFALEGGIIFEEFGACDVNPLEGSWAWEYCDASAEVPDATFSDLTQYTITFTPGAFGQYTLTFTDEVCGDDREYIIEWSEPPVADLDPENYNLCDEESVQIAPDLSEGVACAVNWTWEANQLINTTSLPDYTESSDGSFITVNGTGFYENWEFIATATNGCGSSTVTANVVVHADFELDLDNQYIICDGSELTLDPTAGMPDLAYTWTCTGPCDGFTNGTDTPNLDVTGTGTYTVEVTNGCFTYTETADVAFSPGWEGSWAGTLLECEEDFITVCTDDIVDIPPGFSYTWFVDGESVGSPDCVTLDGPGQLAVEVYDPICDQTYTDETAVQITTAPNLTISPNPLDTAIVCPTEVEVFSIGVVFSGNINWTLENCDGSTIDLGSEESVQLSSDTFPIDCLDEVQLLTMEYENSCGDQTATWPVQASNCQLILPNVFTPDGDLYNNTFTVLGLEKFDRTSLQVFNRWGSLVFESDNYDNTWRADDLSAGTYYYVIQVFDSTDEVLDEYADYLTIFRKD